MSHERVQSSYGLFAEVLQMKRLSLLPLAGCGKTPALVSLVCDAEGAVRE